MEEKLLENQLSPRNKRLGLLVWFRLARFYNESIRQTNHHLKAWNLSAAQFDVLVQIGLYQPISQQELAEKLKLTKGNITQLLKKMESTGWIKREQEWKTKYISLTDDGNCLYKEVVPQQEQFQAGQFCGLNHQELLQLQYLLKKLHKSANIEDEIK